MTSNNTYVYDIETYKNLVVFGLLNIDTMEYTSYGAGHDSLKSLLDLCKLISKGCILIGFNNRHFDDRLLGNLYNAVKDSERWYLIWNKPKTYHKFANLIIKNERDVPKEFDIKYDILPKHIRTYDCREMLRNQTNTSLKDLEIRLGHDNVQELPFPPDVDLMQDEKEIVIKYCENDVRMTHKVWCQLQEQKDIRDALTKKYKIWCGNLSDANAGDRIMRKLYERKKGLVDNYPKTKTYDTIPVSDIIPVDAFKKDMFKAKPIRKLYRKLCNCNIVLHENKYKYLTSEKEIVEKHNLHIYGKDYIFGLGGLHSIEHPTEYFADDTYELLHVDVASYYPNMIINNNIYPAHLSSTWNKILKYLTEKRIALKKEGNDTGAKCMKILINSTFGKLGSKFGWQADKRAMYSVTLSCQLCLLKLIDMLYLKCSDILLANVNTDGIFILIKKTEMGKLLRTCNAWERLFNFDLDVQKYKYLIQENVNQYVALDTDGKIKRKGGIADGRGDVTIPRSSAPIIGMCLSEYVKQSGNLDVSDYVRSCDDMDAFCFAIKCNRGFVVRWGGEVVQNLNRVYYSRIGKQLTKQKKKHKTISKCPDAEKVMLYNNVDNIHTIQDDLDYDYYINKINDFLSLLVDQYHLKQSAKVNEELSTYGMILCEKPTGKKNPVGSTMGDVSYAKSRDIVCSTGLGVVTGPEAGILTIDVDYPDIAKNKLYDMLKPTIVVCKDGDTYDDCINGRVRCKWIYRCSHESITRYKNYLKSGGWEMCYGKDNPVVWGRHPEGRNYIYYIPPKGLASIPRKLLLKLIKDSEKMLISSSDIDTDELDEELFVKLGEHLNQEYGDYKKEYNVPKNKRARKFKNWCWVGDCPGKHLHTTNTTTDAKIFLLDRNIYISCFHQSCLDLRKDVSKSISKILSKNT